MRPDDPRIGGLAGILSAGLLVPAFALLLTMRPGGGAERSLANFQEAPGALTATFGLFVLSQLLYIVFLIGLYRTVCGAERRLARLFLGIGVVGLVIGMLSLHLLASIVHLLGPSQASGSLAGTPLLEALALGLGTLAMAGGTASILFLGLSVLGLGALMWATPGAAVPLALLSVAAGAFMFLSVLWSLFPWPVLAMYGYAALAGVALWGQQVGTASGRPAGESAG